MSNSHNANGCPPDPTPFQSADLSLIPSPHRAGFTLIELLVVVAIIGLLTTIGASIGPGLIRSGAMSGALSQLASGLSQARSEAIRSRKPTFFVLAPTASPLDEKSFQSYAIVQADSYVSSTYRYVSRWEKFPQSVNFQISNSTLATNSFPYPTDGSPGREMLCVAFLPDGGLDEDLHPSGTTNRVALQAGQRASATEAPVFTGQYLTNEVVVMRTTGKIQVQRQ